MNGALDLGAWCPGAGTPPWLWIGGNGDYSGLLLCGKTVSKLSGVYIKTHQLVNKINTQTEGSFVFWMRAVGIRMKSTVDLLKVT